MVETIEWTTRGVVMIDQTRLPRVTEFVTCQTYLEVADAIKTMVIRGAPAIGVAAAMGVALGVNHAAEATLDSEFETICATLAATRPTAVNLRWALDDLHGLLAPLPASRRPDAAYRRAAEICDEDAEICRRIGENGLGLIKKLKPRGERLTGRTGVHVDV